MLKNVIIFGLLGTNLLTLLLLTVFYFTWYVPTERGLNEALTSRNDVLGAVLDSEQCVDSFNLFGCDTPDLRAFLYALDPNVCFEYKWTQALSCRDYNTTNDNSLVDRFKPWIMWKRTNRHLRPY